MALGRKHRRILTAIYRHPISANLLWSDIEGLLRALGATTSEGTGSRVRVTLRGRRAVFHRPHPRSNADKGAIAAVRRLLETVEIKPEERDDP